MTANALADDRQLCLDAGMDDYLTKPLDLQALERMISRVAIPARPAPPGSRREQGR
jgi:two-component system sensor histidine kinase/response regulator